ncbi:hypothetical protein, partial [Candidatus Agathobaculum pullicola]|uniref:hypothetical protein n=1 Tax=Candidatus Agathobaculum pullicola TaxID=2838426 RepID=UPI003F920615
IEPETDDKIRRMTPVGVFFIYPNEDKLGFVNSANLSQSNEKRLRGKATRKRMKRQIHLSTAIFRIR